MRSFRVIPLSIGLALLLTQGGFAFDGSPSKAGAASAPSKTENKNIDPIIFEELSRLAKDPDPYVRLEAVNQLNTWHEDPKAEEVLIAAAHDDIWIVRRASFPYGIPRDLLLDRLVDEDMGIRASAVLHSGVLQAARPNDSRFVDAFLDRLYDPYSKIVYDTLIALGESNDKRAIKPILEFLLSHPEWKSSVEISIKLLTGEPLEKVMEKYRSELKPAAKNKITFKQVDAASQINILERGDGSDRVSAALRLAWSDTPDAVNALIRALEDKESSVRIAAAEALGAYPFILSRATERVLESLKEGATDSDPSVREKSLRAVGWFAFGRYKTDTIEFLRKTAERESNPAIKAVAVRALAGAHTTRSSEILISFLNDSSPEVRADATGGVHLECFPKGLDHLVKALYDPDPSVRRQAAFSLRYVRHKKAIRALVDALIDSDETVRLAAAQSLGSGLGLEDPEAIPPLKQVAETDPSEEVQRWAKYAIRKLEDAYKKESEHPILSRLVELILKLKPLPKHCKD